MRAIGGQSTVALRAVGGTAVARLAGGDDRRPCGGVTNIFSAAGRAPHGLRPVRDYGLIVSDRRCGAVTLHVEDDRTVGTLLSTVARSPWPQFEEPFGDELRVLPQFPSKDLVLLSPSTPNGR